MYSLLNSVLQTDSPRSYEMEQSARNEATWEDQSFILEQFLKFESSWGQEDIFEGVIVTYSTRNKKEAG